MVKLNNNITPDKAEIIFPVRWCYRVVVDAANPDVLQELNAVLEKYQYTERFAIGRASSARRYKSFHVEVEVPNREVMNQLAAELGKVNGVKFLL